MTDAGSLEVEIETAIADFEAGDIKSIIAGAKLIGQITAELPIDLADCKDMQGDIARIESWAAIFKNPKALMAALMKNIPENMTNLEQTIMKTTADINTGEFFYAGEDVAMIMVDCLGPVPAAPAMPEDLMFTQW